MHKLMEYICDEMEELERKADKDGKLSMAEIQYLDTLAHTKKNLLKADEMWEESEYSMEGGQGGQGGSNYARRGYERRGGSNNYEGGSYRSYEARGRGRNARRDSRGRYSREEGSEMMVEELRELMEDAPDDRTRMEFQKFINKIEQM